MKIEDLSQREKKWQPFRVDCKMTSWWWVWLWSHRLICPTSRQGLIISWPLKNPGEARAKAKLRAKEHDNEDKRTWWRSLEVHPPSRSTIREVLIETQWKHLVRAFVTAKGMKMGCHMEKYYHYHWAMRHDTQDSRNLKVKIECLVQEGPLQEYVCSN